MPPSKRGGNRQANAKARRDRKAERYADKRRSFENMLRRRTVAAVMDAEEDASSVGSVDEDVNPLVQLRRNLGVEGVDDGGHSDEDDDEEEEEVGDAVEHDDAVQAAAAVDGRGVDVKELTAALSRYDNVFTSQYVCGAQKGTEEELAPLCRHIVDHIVKRKSEVRARTKRLRQDDDEDEDGDDGDNFNHTTKESSRDSGYVPCRVLVVLPMRNTACKFIEQLIACVGEGNNNNNVSVPNKEKFLVDFGADAEVDNHPNFAKRPADHKTIFQGNIDDKFCIGVTLPTSRDRVYLYSKFLNCDLIVASPLGLAHYVGVGEDDGQSTPEKAVLLSSIEVLAVYPLEVLYQQNWQRLKDVCAVVNAPVTTTSTAGLGDFSRLKTCLMDGTAHQHRQNILLSSYQHPYFTAFFRELTTGSLLGSHQQHLPSTAFARGTIQGLHHASRLRQYFIRVRETSVAAAAEERLAYFKTKFFPTKLSHLINSNIPTVLFVPSYFDFVAVRAFFEDTISESYSELCEYTPTRDIRNALYEFSAGKRTLLLMTERYYYYRRHYVKGAVSLVFYAPPVNSHFYPELVNHLNVRDPSACTMTLFSKYDSAALLRLVGVERAAVFLQQQGEGSTVFTLS
eukprot:PhM_4_TR7811/c0_g1_i1/m.98458/K14774/UTP25, DEF; U3 small nucleolar RNA-associated protein 25